MGYYAVFYNNKIDRYEHGAGYIPLEKLHKVQAMGSDQYIQFDGRYSLGRCINLADECNTRRRFDGYTVHAGNFFHNGPIRYKSFNDPIYFIK